MKSFMGMVFCFSLAYSNVKRSGRLVTWQSDQHDLHSAVALSVFHAELTSTSEK